MSKIITYDTTLRDGTQAEEISFLVEDKVRIAQKLDALGVNYIEGGWPGANPKDIDFFKEIKKHRLENSQIAAFGMTRRAKNTCEHDANLKALVASHADVVTIFGKTWDIHATLALGITLEENLEIIKDSIAYLKQHFKEVFFDAEHFFDGFKANKEYALKVLKAASDSKADCLVLCDTNGGTLTSEITDMIKEVKKKNKIALGIHAHNDSDLAVANTLAAVELGVNHVQGTINGFGERSGNANLCSIIPNLQLKMKKDVLGDDKLKMLRETSRYVNEIANLSHKTHQPFVGDSAFAHKGGIHVSAVRKSSHTYEHITPELVGNQQRILLSDLSGKSNIIEKAKNFDIHIDPNDPITAQILKELKELEHKGFAFEGAEGSFELIMKKALGLHKSFFNLIGFRVIDESRADKEKASAEATIMVEVGGQIEHTAATGNGPVNALDNALRKALEKFYPQLKKVKLKDYKVRVLKGGVGTGSLVRVLIESSDSVDSWGTVGVSENIIQASWQALVDSIDYKLLKDEHQA
ncbi:citramalate synthase [Thermodesulfobacteriota bacterium]